MEKTKDKERKKGRNKEKKNFIQPPEDLPVTFGSWNKRISTLRRQNEVAISAQVNPPETATPQQSAKAPTHKGITKKGQAERRDQDNTKTGTVPKYRILQRKPEDAPQQGAAPEEPQHQDAGPEEPPQQGPGPEEPPQQGATTEEPPQQAATSEVVPQKAGKPSGAKQQACEATELTRGPVQRKKLWTPPPPPPYRTPLREHPGEVKDTDFKRGPVKQKRLWTPPPPYRTPLKAPSGQVKATDCQRGPVQQKMLWTAPHQHIPQAAKPQQASRVKACVGVEAPPQQDTIHVPVLQHQQPGIRETEKNTELEKANAALAALVTQLKETPMKACDGVEASPQEAMIHVSELELQQLRSRRAEQNNKLKKENGNLAAEVEQLKETLQRNKALHEKAMLKRVNKIVDLELQLSETTEAEALQKLQLKENHHQRQKEIQKNLDVCLAQQIENNNKLKAALTLTQRELVSQQLQWQEERSRLLQTLSDIHHTLQEEEKALDTRWGGMTDRIVGLEQQLKNISKKPKRPSLMKRFLQLIK